MKILLLYPQYPDTFWSFKYSIRFIRKKALLPPLGLATIAAMLPNDFEVRLVDMNIEKLREKDLLWADFVFISAMITQKDSVYNVIRQCKELGVKTVAGGPLFSSLSHEFPEIDHFVLDEGEITFPMFLEDLQKSDRGELKRYYRSEVKPDIKNSPIPRWELFKQKDYVRMPIQYSRGCPFDCEFCDVVRLNGKIPRTKSPEQIIRELDALFDAGWKRHVFFVDDNFIGNKNECKALLKALADWRKRRFSKITFMTEVSLNVADDPELMDYLRNAGFNSLFIGLETPSEESLAECGKFQNRNRDILSSLKTLYKNGFEISAGFIVGFDHDDAGIFKRQIDFIQKSGVVIAMIGLLQAIPGTRLYERLKQENRLISDGSGNNTDFSINFVPKLDTNLLIDGYKQIVNTVYANKEYYERVLTFIKSYNHHVDEHFNFDCLLAVFKSMFYMGIIDESRGYYWRTFFISLLKYRQNLPKFIIMSIYYAHFKRVLVEYGR